MNEFKFSKELKIYIYGINDYAERLCNILRKSGYTISAYIDRRAIELNHTHRGYIVFDLEELLDIDDSDCVIIVLQNALQHEMVAEQLYRKGFEKIIFLPINGIYNDRSESMCNAYNSIVYQFETESRSIPNYESWRRNVYEGIRIIKHNNDWVTAYIPYHMIYTALSEKEYADIPILNFKPYRELFNFLDSGCLSKPPELYLKRYGVNSCNYTNNYDDRGILKQRKELFDVWERHYYTHDGYFESGAPIASWNKHGYYNLTEGQHRVMYLELKGEIFVPVRLKGKEYEQGKTVLNKYFRYNDISAMRERLQRDISVI